MTICFPDFKRAGTKSTGVLHFVPPRRFYAVLFVPFFCRPREKCGTLWKTIWLHNVDNIRQKDIKFNCLLKFCVKILFCKHYVSPLNTFMRKGKDPDPELDPYPSVPNGYGSGRPKSIQIRIPNTDAQGINDYQICRPLVSVCTEGTSRSAGFKLHHPSITFLLVVCLSVIIHTGTGRIYLYRKLLSITSWDRDDSFSPGGFFIKFW